jgi:DNA-binding beta-propeller fold protein YncE
MSFASKFGSAAVVGALLAGTALAGVAYAADPYTGYRVSKVIPLPGKKPDWDHISMDPENRNVFIGRADDGVTVYNIDTGAVKQVAETKGSNGVAIVPELGIGMSDNGTFNNVTIFDLKTLAVKSHVKVTKETDGVGWDPATKTAYVNNGEDGTFTLFDPVSGKIGETIALANSKKPEFFFSDGNGRVFVNLQDKNQVAVIDMKTKKLAATWPVDCQAPTGMYYEDKSDRVFVSCRGTKPVLAVIDAKSGKTVTTVPIGANSDGLGFNPIEKLVLVPNGASGTVSVIKQDGPDAYHLVETVATRIHARTLTVDPKTGKAVTAAPESTLPAKPPGGAKAAPQKFIADSFSIIVLERTEFE